MRFASFRQPPMNYKMYMGDADLRKLMTVPDLKRSDLMSILLDWQNDAKRIIAKLYCS